MNGDVGSVICLFCGEPGSRERALACGLGARICVPCLVNFHTMGTAAGRVDPLGSSGELSDEEMLARLPVILAARRQIDDFAHASVTALRERQVTWTAIGGTLGISRQAAWERYSKRGTPAAR